MERLPKDILIHMALNMDIPEILTLCKTSKRLNLKICKNTEFWVNKFSAHNMNPYVFWARCKKNPTFNRYICSNREFWEKYINTKNSFYVTEHISKAAENNRFDIFKILVERYKQENGSLDNIVFDDSFASAAYLNNREIVDYIINIPQPLYRSLDFTLGLEGAITGLHPDMFEYILNMTPRKQLTAQAVKRLIEMAELDQPEMFSYVRDKLRIYRR